MPVFWLIRFRRTIKGEHKTNCEDGCNLLRNHHFAVEIQQDSIHTKNTTFPFHCCSRSIWLPIKRCGVSLAVKFETLVTLHASSLGSWRHLTSSVSGSLHAWLPQLKVWKADYKLTPHSFNLDPRNISRIDQTNRFRYGVGQSVEICRIYRLSKRPLQRFVLFSVSSFFAWKGPSCQCRKGKLKSSRLHFAWRLLSHWVAETPLIIIIGLKKSLKDKKKLLCNKQRIED